MASGTITGSVYKSSGVATTGYGVRMVWSSAKNVSDNYSDITVSLQICKKDGYDSSYTYKGTITIDSTPTSYEKYITIPKSGAWVEIGKATKRVGHNNDGSKSCSISATGTTTSTSFNKLGGWSASSITLDTIPRASSIDSVTNANFGTYPVIKWTPKNSTFQYRFRYTFGTKDTGWTSPFAPASLSQQSYSGLVLLESWMDSIPSSTSGTITAYLKTENSSGAQIGDVASKTFTGYVPNSVVPTISDFTVTRVNNGVPSSWGVYVQGKSKCTVSMKASGMRSSSIKESYISQGSSKIKTSTTTGSSVTTSVTAGPFSSNGSIAFSGGVTDTRSRSTTTTPSQKQTITVVRYSAPQITSVLSQRCESDGTLSDDGKYIKCTCVYRYWGVNNKNSATCKVSYKTGSDSWSTPIALDTKTTTSGSDSEFIVTATKIIGEDKIDPNNTYDLEYKVTDALNEFSRGSDIVSTSFVLMDFRSTGHGMAVGKVSEKDEFECNLISEFYKAVTTPNLYDLRRGIEIPAGADLDEYKDVGIYYSPDSITSQTLINTPWTGSNFKLIVEQPGASTYRKQRVITGSSAHREYNRSYVDGVWSKWGCVLDTSSTFEFPFSSSQTVGVLKNRMDGINFYPVWGCVDITNLGLNLNDLTYSGVYMWRGTAPTNSPGGGKWKFLINMRFGGYGAQICLGFGSALMHYRYSTSDATSSGSWSDWSKITLS